MPFRIKPTVFALLLTIPFITEHALAETIAKVNVSVNDKQCDPMTLTVPTGKTQFIIKNNSMKALEWEILNGVIVVEERENIAPGFMQKMTVDLQPGTGERCDLDDQRVVIVIDDDVHAGQTHHLMQAVPAFVDAAKTRHQYTDLHPIVLGEQRQFF